MNPFSPSSTKPPIVRSREERSKYHDRDQDKPRGHREHIMSQSSLVEFLECPSKWIRSEREDDDDKTKALRWGSLIDTLATDEMEFERKYAVAPATYESKGMECPICKTITDSQKCAKCKTARVEVTIQKEWDWKSTTCQAWRDERLKAGQDVVTEEQANRARTAVHRLESDPKILELMSVSDKQVMCNVDYIDPVTKLVIPFKSMIDLIPRSMSRYHKHLGDLKTTNDASIRKWIMTVNEWRLDLQGAVYIDVWNAASGEARNQFVHVISESVKPYEPARRQLGQEFLTLGRGRYLAGMQFYCRCLEENHWPSYDEMEEQFGTSECIDGAIIVEPFEWMVKQ